MKLIPLPAFQDNYLWVLHNAQRALVVDPGDAQPVTAFLQREGLQLEAILVTHHHPDHIGGVDALRQATGAQVWGPQRERIPEPLTGLAGGDSLDLLGLRFTVLDVPGHTAGHIAYYCESFEGRPLLFCSDTLFWGGCGRLFEGAPAQMLASLDKLAALPANTRLCCSHGYTLSKKFAKAVEPDNRELIDYSAHSDTLRAQGLRTLPSSIGQERQINPFLRSREESMARTARSHGGLSVTDTVAVFATLRQWKNEFK